MKKYSVAAIYISGKCTFGGASATKLTVCGYGMHSLTKRVFDVTSSASSCVLSLAITDTAITVTVPEGDSVRVCDALIKDLLGV